MIGSYNNKIKDHKSLGERAEVYQIQFNSSNYVKKKLVHTSVIFDLTAIVFKKKKDLGSLVFELPSS